MRSIGGRFWKTVGSAGVSAAWPAAMLGAAPFAGAVAQEVAQPSEPVIAKPQHEVRFSVCGMSHDHIYGMVDAMVRGGGALVSVYAAEPERGAAFLKRYPQAKAAATEQVVIEDPSIQLVLSSAVPNERAGIGVRAMRHGKDYLSDKPGITTLEQLAEIRKTIAETGRTYAIMYSERLEVKAAVKAGELVQAGAIGKVIQTINIVTRTRFSEERRCGRRRRAAGLVLGAGEVRRDSGCDIGSRRWTSSCSIRGQRRRKWVASQVANVRHKDKPRFQDFGDMMLRGNAPGFGYVRLDWYHAGRGWARGATGGCSSWGRTAAC